jgi:hypothetical protein
MIGGSGSVKKKKKKEKKKRERNPPNPLMIPSEYTSDVSL